MKHSVQKELRNVTDIMRFDSSIVESYSHQSLNTNVDMVEALMVDIDFAMEGSLPLLAAEELCNNEWADAHFEERVCGYPINPGHEYKNWPWAKHAEEHKGQIFNHNYMERYWPKFAGDSEPTYKPVDFEEKYGHLVHGPFFKANQNYGIRGKYGDLNDVVSLMLKDPHTRQAYLPIFFPEDTGDANEGRKPCTLGYHFIIRGNCLHVVYHIRSCDFYRHMVDDIYLTVKLAVWVQEQLAKGGLNVQLGRLRMNITSLHMFLSDYQLIFKEQHGDLS